MIEIPYADVIPIYCVMAAFLIVYLVKIPVAMAMAKTGGGRYDNRHPRAQQAQLTGWGARALAAHQNGFEGFAPFAAAVVLAQMWDADPSYVSLLALTHVAARVLYNVLYIANLAQLRSTVWFVGFGTTLALFLAAV